MPHDSHDTSDPTAWAGRTGRRPVGLLVLLAAVVIAVIVPVGLDEVGCRYHLALDGLDLQVVPQGGSVDELRAALPSCVRVDVVGEDGPGAVVLDGRLGAGTRRDPVVVLVGPPRFLEHARLPWPPPGPGLAVALGAWSSCTAAADGTRSCLVWGDAPPPEGSTCAPLEVPAAAQPVRRCEGGEGVGAFVTP